MELLQVFDNKKNILNEYVERDKKKELPEGKNFMIILLFIQNDNGEFLIQKVSKNKGDVYATTGGHTTYGYDNFTTAINECKEDLGIELSKNELCLVYSDRIKNCFVETFYCKKELDINCLNLQEEEVESVSWMSIEDIEKLILNNKFRKGNIPAFKTVINYIKNQNELEKKYSKI